MIVRVQSPIGTKKFDVLDSDNLEKLLQCVASEFKLTDKGAWFLSTSRNDTGRIKGSRNIKLKSLGIKHGDMLFLIDKSRTTAPGDSVTPTDDNSLNNGSKSSARFGNREMVVEDKIDQELAKMDGQIRRKRNEQLCHHPESGKCIHCVPLEPFDAAYLEHLDPPVKFMSFHAYLRKLSGGQGMGKYVTLENLSCKVRSGCQGHPPWPEGICTKCQPNPVTLEIQPYRHVDYVQFENGQLMETFLDYWRQTGEQRIGILLGRYAHFDTAGSPPLAIKAVVAAIYEPLQESTTRSVKLTAPLDALLPDHVAEVTKRLGLQPVGWIFTDLVAEDQPGKGAVKHYRGTMDTFFLSAEECVTAACLQNLYPNKCRYSSDGCFGSKFVTVVVTGDASNDIHFEAYQVSNQAMALVRDNILVPTYDAPEFGYIRETTKDQFVPEVFYTLTDKYGNRVTRVARPLPVEYLLVDMPAAFPIEPVFTMAKIPADVPMDCRFPVENREALGQIQNFSGFAKLLKRFSNRPLYSLLANFHLLTWFAGNDVFPLRLQSASDTDPHGLSGLLDAISSVNNLSGLSTAERQTLAEAAVAKWASDSPAWNTVQELAKAFSGDPSSPPQPKSKSDALFRPSGTRGTTSAVSIGSDPMDTTTATTITNNPEGRSSASKDFWACAHCTFHNHLDVSECEMCGLPKDN
ncbi:Nuclear protein localization protein 4 [Clonorchis sinensis]|uniref:Nuclear protein localization protein 4 n=2 Tax=Clonorchis sinensis TaxID=79923 RepID=A0A8T1N0X4_CLOSI|nr:Nuclear protein localization protein 4 [Clonorchis sinensis]